MDRPCKACGTPLRFLRTSEGKIIPLDLRAPVFAVYQEGGEWKCALIDDAYASHFATCSKASEFSKGSATDPAQAELKFHKGST